ncbi:hypothetical protein [Leucobacter sp. wl10]|uniref:hypothetical protein n=1 Tax=Leucobacter sp. wl10 TaxID=2304677 RepID=UPI000E5B377B|nr:hypothetical protein [Leucobacter sp. wl10]RGE23141.1 hypothetical protein D1J51_02560 [Leucobacter sp. wl10]
MDIPERIRCVADALLSVADLRGHGATSRELEGRLRAGSLLRVAHGWFVERETWNTWFPEGRHLAKVMAAHRNAIEPPLFSHHSAAVLHGLPLWGLRDEPVHTVSTTSTTRSGLVARHRLTVPTADTGHIVGIHCTSAERTIADLSRIATEEMTLGCADAALRLRARRERDVDAGLWRDWREEMRERARASAGARGIRLLRRVVEFADPRADSTLESVSRLHFHRLHIPVDLQVSVPAPNGGFYYADFKLLGLGILGEADGDAKYSDPKMLGGMTPAERVLREKRRDNWISGTTGDRMIHWGSRDAGTLEHFARMLRSFKVPIPLRDGR